MKSSIVLNPPTTEESTGSKDKWVNLYFYKQNEAFGWGKGTFDTQTLAKQAAKAYLAQYSSIAEHLGAFKKLC